MSASQSGRADQSDDNEPQSGDEQPEMSDLYAQLEGLEEMVDSHAAREHVRETMRMAVDIGSSDVFGRIIRGYDRADIAESVLGALLFGIPMFVEGGTNEVGEFVATNPLYFVGTHVLTLGVVISIIYVADIQDVRVHRPFFWRRSAAASRCDICLVRDGCRDDDRLGLGVLD